MSVIMLLVAAAGIVIAAFTLYQTLFMVAGLPAVFRSQRRPDRSSGGRTRFAIVIPAHNEAGLIEGTVASLIDSDYPVERRDVYVIADNCSDDTAGRARAAGATCHERTNLTLRGKPYALDWMIRQIDLDRYDAIVIVDADTIVDRQFLAVMDMHVMAGEQSIQGHIGVMNPDENWLTRLGVLPASVKYRLHYPGKRALGLSCPLAGNGMCFSTALMRRFGWNAFSITENWEYYVMLALHGYTTTPAIEAKVYGQVARTLKLGTPQRVRWMQGQIETLQRYWRPLIARGIRELSPLRIDALIELARPSHANLLFAAMGLTVVCAALVAFGIDAARPWLLVGIVSFALQVLYFLAGFLLERPPLKTWLALLMVPWYLMWKGAVALKGLFNLSDRSWVKTTRN